MLNDLFLRYQSYDPQRRAFDAERSIREYAELLGISYVYASQILSGVRRPGTLALAGLLRAFPESRDDLAEALTTSIGVARVAS